ncbi:MAG: hypothetical protein VR65_26150 [Desulfobulbaceae bacterium BRH_c16a]|nr:MAG: hypothetical protein VR65_26150 [Desulfobulbaceae bacterium BRH_c16a]
MAYSYLLDLYRTLAEKENEIKKRQEAPSVSLEADTYLQGRLAAVNEFSIFLKDNFHTQLPRRLRQK